MNITQCYVCTYIVCLVRFAIDNSVGNICEKTHIIEGVEII